MEQHRIGRAFYHKPLCLGLLVLSMGIAPAHAQNQSIEERLRALVRSANAEAEQAKAQSAAQRIQLTAEQAAHAALDKELVQLKADLAAERARARQLNAGNAEVRREAQAAQASLEKAGQQTAQYRNAQQELLQQAGSSKAEATRLAGELAANGNAVRQCEAKNVQLYMLGRQILSAYESIDVATVVAARQPFADRARVKFDEIAQGYGDRLYEGKFDARAAGVGSVSAKPAAATP